MTLTASSTVTTATGNGAQTAFTFPWKCFSTTDVKVYKAGVLQVSGYTVTINYNATTNPNGVGGTVTFSAAPANATALVFVRVSDIDQNYDPQPGAQFNEAAIEASVDNAVMISQEQREAIDRSLRVPVYNRGINCIMPTPIASKLIRWDATGLAIELVDSATVVTEGGGGGGGGGGTLSTVGFAAPTSLFTVSPTSLSADGTFTASLTAAAQNAVWVGPTSGSGAPSYRALVVGDIPSLAASKITSGTFTKAVQNAATVYNDAANTFSTGVQDFGATGVTLVLPLKSDPGSPTTGEIWINGTAFKIQDGTGTTRNVVTSALSINTTTPLAGGGALTGDLTITLGTVTMAKGGTNITSYTDGDLLVANTSGTLVKLPAGTNGQFLTINTGNNPKYEWVTGGGAVSSVAATGVSGILSISGSPITSSGTLAFSLDNQTANTVLAGATSGGAAAPTFRALVIGDIPVISIVKGGTNNAGLAVTAGTVYYGDGTKLVGLAIGTAGQLLAVNGGATAPTWITASGTGTVTSVDVSLPSWLTVSGNPITTSGTLAITAAGSQTQNRVLASPDGSSGTVSLRALVAADIPSLAASKITSGTLAVAQGGTNIASYTAGDIPYASGSTTISKLGIGTALQVLRTNAGATAPEWAAAAIGFTSAPGSTITGNTTGVAGSSYNADSSGGAFNFTLPTAVSVGGQVILLDHVTAGNAITVLTTSSQTVGGLASGAITLSQAGNQYVFWSNGANWRIL